MIRFLLKGLLRDRHRSLFPIIIVAAGAGITVLAYCWILGITEDLIASNAKMDTGHIKIMTQGYADLAGQIPNDLFLTKISHRIRDLENDYPMMDWTPRIKFGGLLDFPDESGETRVQGPVFGMALDLLSPVSVEKKYVPVAKALVRGRMPERPGEILISEMFARTLDVQPNEMATLVSATANGSMAVHNFWIVGTIRFGIGPMDRNAMLADISDIQYALDMPDGAGEILGFFHGFQYDRQAADTIALNFNSQHSRREDELSPRMLTLREQNNIGEFLDFVAVEILIIVSVLIFVMSIVLWNAGLMSGLRRYGEMGVRLAIGESKSHVYYTLISESLLIGLIGSMIGTVFGLVAAFYLQEKGLDISYMIKGSTMLLSNVFRAKVTTAGFFIGLIPGLLATNLGTLISGIGIFKRQTSSLFKELEV